MARFKSSTIFTVPISRKEPNSILIYKYSHCNWDAAINHGIHTYKQIRARASWTIQVHITNHYYTTKSYNNQSFYIQLIETCLTGESTKTIASF